MDDLLERLEAAIERATPGELEEIDRLIGPELQRIWLPVPGPQTEAYESEADILLYGGAAGGGKSDLLLGTALTSHYAATIYRRSYVDIIGEGGLGPRLVQLLGSRDGYRESPAPSWTDGVRTLEFGALEKPGAEMSAQGRAKDFIGFDEGAQLSEAKVRFVIGWLRTTRPGQRCRIVIATNPPQTGEGLWLLTWFAPWLDPAFASPAKPGELRWAAWSPNDKLVWLPDNSPVVFTDGVAWRLATPEEAADLNNPDVQRPKSYTFIPSRLIDNPYLKGTGYLSTLQSLPEPLRTQLMRGDFLAGREDDAYQVIPTAWVKAARARWSPDGDRSPQICLGVDVAQGGKDETTLAPLHGEWFGPLVAYPGKQTPDGPSVAALSVQHRKGRAFVVIDCTGGWGGSAADHLTAQSIPVHRFVASQGSQERSDPGGEFGFVNQRAEVWWRMREGLDPSGPSRIALPPDDALEVELTTPRWELKRGKVQVESKDDIRERIGRSTDRADAVVTAWAKRATGLLMQAIDAQAAHQTAPESDPW